MAFSARFFGKNVPLHPAKNRTQFAQRQINLSPVSKFADKFYQPLKYRNYQMSKKTYFFLSIAFSFFAVMSWKSFQKERAVKETGSIAYPFIVEKPRYSSSTASMIVSLNGKRYRLEIGLNYCSFNNCKIGGRVKVIYSSAHDAMILPETNVAAGMWASVLLSLVSLYCLYELLVKKSPLTPRKTARNSRKGRS